MKRLVELKTNEYYHVFNKSIAKFVIFNSDDEYQRMVRTLLYYQTAKRGCSLSDFLRLNKANKNKLDALLSSTPKEQTSWIKIIAFCLMPTHIHLLLRQNLENGISIFMSNALNSYACYFNKKHKREGPLWTGRFKAVHIETDDQLWHVSRYIHLNPTTANLVKRPELWKYSSYPRYIKTERSKFSLPTTSVFDCTPKEYQKFVENQISYQKQLTIIQHLTL
ncbi:MAG: transposase [Candidatus Omnitrophica bacterium]|nr:transposase [Candidatus Omnitrophota bacterium]